MKKLILTLSILAQLAILRAQHSIQVTYLSNEGFLIESSDKKVIIDAPHPYYVSNYTQERMKNNLEPFNNVDLSLATHNHLDHFDANMVAVQMNNSPETYFIGPQEVTSLLNAEPGYTDFSSRVITLTPGWNKYTDTIINGIKIRAMRLHHDAQSMQNIGYLIELDSMKIFHTGDYSGDYTGNHASNIFYELDTFHLKNENIDIAFLNFYSFWDGKDRQNALKKSFDAKHIVLMHIDPGSEKAIADSAKNMTGYPPITVFQHRTDKKVFTKQADSIIVTNGNNAPLVNKTIPDAHAKVSATFNYTVPSETFSDADLNDQLSFSARLSNGDSLPDWLQFSSNTHTFSGIPNSTVTLSVEVTANDTSYANGSDIFRIIISASNAIDSKTSSGITIFPNPTNGLFLVSFGTNTIQKTVVQVYNLQGKLVVSETAHNKTTVTIDLSDYPKGMYFIKTNYEGNLYSNKLLLK
jgi:L-ascorbate metabolism protein UlaG (beta-lactamase superfamily)